MILKWRKNRDPYSGTSVSLAFLMPPAVASITTNSFSLEFNRTSINVLAAATFAVLPVRIKELVYGNVQQGDDLVKGIQAWMVTTGFQNICQ